MILNVLLYSKQRSQRIIYEDIDGIMTSEIEQTFRRKCDVVSLRTGGARIRASQKTRDALSVLEEKYDDASKRHIRKLKAFISKLTDTDEFYFFNEDKTTIVERRTAIACLRSDVGNGLSFELFHSEAFHYYSMMDSNFEYLSYGFDGKIWQVC